MSDDSILQTLASIPCVDGLKHAQTIIDELRGKGIELYHAHLDYGTRANMLSEIGKGIRPSIYDGHWKVPLNAEFVPISFDPA